jgi:hypothetical protein
MPGLVALGGSIQHQCWRLNRCALSAAVPKKNAPTVSLPSGLVPSIIELPSMNTMLLGFTYLSATVWSG